jgi:hypothetical protein
MTAPNANGPAGPPPPAAVVSGGGTGIGRAALGVDGGVRPAG